MRRYSLPESIFAAGVEYPIRTDFRAVLDVMAAMNDPDLDDCAKNMVMLQIMVPDWRKIPERDLREVLSRLVDFIDCGNQDDGKPHPKLYDWDQDAIVLIPAINSVAHTDIRALPHLHWWTFLSYFMEIRESTFSDILAIRQKLAKHKKLEKYEREFLQANRDIVVLRTRDSDEVKREKDNILKWL